VASEDALASGSGPEWRRTFRPDLLAGQSALITGGGSGIGYAIAMALGELGADLAIVGRNQARLAAARQRIAETTGRQVEAIAADIRDFEELSSAYDQIAQALGGIDIVVNNAGGQFAARFEDISAGGFRAVVETNLMGTFHSCKCATALMKQHGGGRIVNIVNEYSFDRGGPEFAHSGAARAGVVNLTYTLALELAPYAINVNALSPGTIETAGMDASYGGSEHGDWLDRCRRAIPMRRFGTQDEVAAAVVFLVSPAAAYLTGTVIRLDGGGYLGNTEYAWPDAMGSAAPPEAAR
jgi:NAD(P)-dependent dehydrogenase (short-subunit alcohol dehydrogenase family)